MCEWGWSGRRVSGCGHENETVMCEGVMCERGGSCVKRIITCEPGCGCVNCLVMFEWDVIRIRIRIVTGETPKRQSLTRTCD